MSTEERRIRSLIVLLSEEDPERHAIIRNRLLEYGEIAVPYLQEVLTGKTRGSDRAAEILEELRLNRLEREVASYSAAKEPDIEDGAFLLAQLKYPEATRENFRPLLDGMAGALKKKIGDLSNPRMIVDTTCRYLFIEETFRGNTQNYYDPDNSYLNRVLERKTGIPISLAVVTLLVTRRIGLPFHGIGTPGHFLLRYGENPDGILIDPFNGGNLRNRDEMIRSLIFRGIRFQRSHFEPVGNREILARMIRNLIEIYRERQEEPIVRRLTLFRLLIAQGSSST